MDRGCRQVATGGVDSCPENPSVSFTRQRKLDRLTNHPRVLLEISRVFWSVPRDPTVGLSGL